MATDYYNGNGEKLTIIHFPGSGLNIGKEVANLNFDRKIFISNDLTIISIMDKSCFKNSFIAKQLTSNNISVYNTAMEVKEWTNVIKIKHILKCLDMINTKYVLILDGRDTVITSNLDNKFIEKYKLLNKPIVYNSTPFPHPNVAIEALNELIHIKGNTKYLNAGVCIGEINALKQFYQKADEISQKYPTNTSEQLIIRKAKQLLPALVGIDSENKLFKVVHQTDSKIKETLKGKMII